jgi:hypothetical protein
VCPPAHLKGHMTRQKTPTSCGLDHWKRAYHTSLEEYLDSKSVLRLPIFLECTADFPLTKFNIQRSDREATQSFKGPMKFHHLIGQSSIFLEFFSHSMAFVGPNVRQNLVRHNRGLVMWGPHGFPMVSLFCVGSIPLENFRAIFPLLNSLYRL